MIGRVPRRWWEEQEGGWRGDAHGLPECCDGSAVVKCLKGRGAVHPVTGCERRGAKAVHPLSSAWRSQCGRPGEDDPGRGCIGSPSETDGHFSEGSPSSYPGFVDFLYPQHFPSLTSLFL